jgi:hypothetical protein
MDSSFSADTATAQGFTIRSIARLQGPQDGVTGRRLERTGIE